MRSSVGYVWVDSPLHRAPAAAKLVGLLVAVVLVVLASSPVELALAAFGVAALVAVSRVGWRAALRSLWGLRWFLLVVLCMNALFFSASDPLLSLGPVRLTLAGAAQGAHIVARTALVVVLGTLLTATTRPQQLTSGVRDLLRPSRASAFPPRPRRWRWGSRCSSSPRCCGRAASSCGPRPCVVARPPRVVLCDAPSAMCDCSSPCSCPRSGAPTSCPSRWRRAGTASTAVPGAPEGRAVHELRQEGRRRRGLRRAGHRSCRWRSTPSPAPETPGCPCTCPS